MVIWFWVCMVKFRGYSWLSAQKLLLPWRFIWDAGDLTQVCTGSASCKRNTLVLCYSCVKSPSQSSFCLSDALVVPPWLCISGQSGGTGGFLLFVLGHTQGCSGATLHSVLRNRFALGRHVGMGMNDGIRTTIHLNLLCARQMQNWRIPFPPQIVVVFFF